MKRGRIVGDAWCAFIDNREHSFLFEINEKLMNFCISSLNEHSIERERHPFLKDNWRKWLGNGTGILGKDEQAVGNALPNTKYIIMLSERTRRKCLETPPLSGGKDEG
jgi:hypothetical protein